MENLSFRRLGRALAATVAALLLIVGILSVPWRPTRPAERPRITSLARGRGPVSAGAAEVPFDPPRFAPIAGYARLVYDSVGQRDPVGVRAVVLQAEGCTVALASADLLLVPGPLAEAVRARVADLRLDGLVVAATHTHASLGGWWDHALAERLATGPFDPALLDLVAGRIADAIRAAMDARVPARIGFGFAAHPELARNRAGSPEIDGRLNVVRVAGEDGGAPIAELILFAAHPTILGKANRELSADWPGRVESARDRRGVRLVFQGAVGDQSTKLPWKGRYGVDEYGGVMSSAVSGVETPPGAAAVPLAWAEARVVLPDVAVGAAPALVRPALRTLFGGILPSTARVAALAIGPLTLLVVPAEPTAAVGERWRKEIGGGAEILSVAGDYLGYVELPGRVDRGEGEAKRTYYGPDLAGRLAAGLAAATEALRSPRPAQAGTQPMLSGAR